MNKFIVFATFVVILAVMPSNLGCAPWVYRTDHSKDRRTSPIQAELLDLIEQGFTVCNTDSEPGLTWPEINNCQVSGNRYQG